MIIPWVKAPSPYKEYMEKCFVRLFSKGLKEKFYYSSCLKVKPEICLLVQAYERIDGFTIFDGDKIVFSEEFKQSYEFDADQSIVLDLSEITVDVI